MLLLVVLSGPTLLILSALPNCRHLSGALKEEGEAYFLQKIEVPHGQTLDVIALDTVLLQVGYVSLVSFLCTSLVSFQIAFLNVS